MDIEKLQLMAEELKKIPISKSIVISGHENPDYDSICSTFALALVLKQLGKKVTVLLEKQYESMIDWIEETEYVKDFVEEIDYFILLDANRKARLAKYEPLFNNANITINIDHHEKNANEAMKILVETEASSTCEILYQLFEHMNIVLTPSIAKLLYVGIYTDSKGLTEQITSKTLEIMAKLLTYEIPYQEIIKRTYSTISMHDMKSLAYFIENIKYDGFYYVVVDKRLERFQNFNHNIFVKRQLDMIQNIKEVDILVGFIIDSSSICCEFRSNCNIDVHHLAILLGGGGHKKRAGCTTSLSLNELIIKIKEYIQKERENGTIK